jgi:hypothetical protein
VTQCLHCGHPFEVIRPIVNQANRPKPGSVVACERCLGLNFVTSAMTFRRLTDDEERLYMRAHFRRAVKALTGLEL